MGEEAQQWEDFFWGQDYAGFEVISNKMRASKHATQGLLDFIKGRVKIHEEFGRKMQAHVKTEMGGGLKAESGTLKEAWDVLLVDAEQCAQIHINAAQEVSNRIEKPLIEYLKTKREEVKTLEDNIRKAQQSRNNANSRVVKAQTTFENKTKEFQSLSEKTRTANTKEQPKLQTKLKAKHGELEAADMALVTAIENTVSVQGQWGEETRSGFRKLQEIEAERYDRLRGDVWKMQNVLALALTAQDQSIEQTRVSLENVSFVRDQEHFIETNSTGKELPDYPDICYMHPNSIVSKGPRAAKPPKAVAGGLKTQSSPDILNSSNASLDALKNQVEAVKKSASVADTEMYGSNRSIVEEAPVGLVYVPPDDDDNGGDLYKELSPTASIQSPETSKPPFRERKQPAVPPSVSRSPKPAFRTPVVRARVLYDYPSQGNEELTLRVGEVIVVLEKENATWWKGRNDEGVVGMFPSEFTEFIS